MRRSILCSLVVFVMALARNAAADKVLVNYGFDGTLPTPQEGFFLFQNSRGSVEPTDKVKFSGYRSLELQEAPLDHDFVELQGVVEPIASGNVLFHFAILVRNPDEALNIAVAGPQHFSMQHDGIAFWLKSIDGALFTETDSLPKRLFRVARDTWYVVDVVFHVTEGSYDLRILESGIDAPVVLLKDQPNATHSLGSKLSKISFIGDLEDRSSVHYFVDDVELRLLSRNLDLGAPTAAKAGTPSRSPTKPSAVEPDRRFIETGTPSSRAKGYFDEYLEVKQLELSTLECLPATGLRDFGIDRTMLASDPTLRDEVQRAIHLKASELATAPAFLRSIAQSIVLWRRGCQALASADLAAASLDIRESLALAPDSSIAQAALVLVLTAQKQRLEAEREMLSLYPRWGNDARLAVLVGITSAAWSNFDEARQALSGIAAQITQPDSPQFIGQLLSGDHHAFEDLQAAFGNDWPQALDDLYIGQSYFYSLLFTSRYAEAIAFAEKLVNRYDAIPGAARAWREREADALVLAGKVDEARRRYEAIAKDCGACDGAKEKLLVLR